MKPIILASRSPRRRELLTRVGIPFEAISTDVDETVRTDESVPHAVERLALDKARAARREATDRTVLAADTLVVLDDRPLGKPKDANDAISMLRCLSGRWHQVVTGVALVASDGSEQSLVASTDVCFATLLDEEIRRYVASCEPMDKAGSYALQGKALWFVREVRGSVSNVIGLPLEHVRLMMQAAGLPLPTLDRRAE